MGFSSYICKGKIKQQRQGVKKSGRIRSENEVKPEVRAAGIARGEPHTFHLNSRRLTHGGVHEEPPSNSKSTSGPGKWSRSRAGVGARGEVTAKDEGFLLAVMKMSWDWLWCFAQLCCAMKNLWIIWHVNFITRKLFKNKRGTKKNTQEGVWGVWAWV